MLVLEAFSAKYYPYDSSGLTHIEVNIPSLFPLKVQNDSIIHESVVNIYKNKFDVSNTIQNKNSLLMKVAAGTRLKSIINKGDKFLLISPDSNPENGVLVLF